MIAQVENIHAAVLVDVRQKIAALESELVTLRAVEAYHAKMADEKPQDIDYKGLVAQSSSRARSDKEYTDKSKHEAAAMALQELGGQGRTGEIVRLLRSHGYSGNLTDGILRNALFTAMKRKPETFERTAEGLWVLKAGENGK